MREHEQIWCQRWGISHYADYLRRMLEVGTTPNGVFGMKAHWYQFAEVSDKLRQIPDYRTVSKADALARLLPNLRYVWLTRRDKVRQAVSYARALQTKDWWEIDGPIDKTTCIPPIVEELDAPPKIAQFDAVGIDRLLKLLKTHDAAWEQYFVQEHITPVVVTYEDLAEAYNSTIRRILQELGIAFSEPLILNAPRLKKQADGQSEQWVRRYQESQQANMDINHVSRKTGRRNVEEASATGSQIQYVSLCVQWDLGGCTPEIVEELQQYIEAAIQATRYDNRVKVSKDFMHVQMKSGPFRLDRQVLQAGIDTFNRVRELFVASVPTEVIATETTTLFFTNGGKIIELETLNAIAEIASPSLLLLLGQQGGKSIGLNIAGDVLRLVIPSTLRANMTGRLIPFLVGLLALFIRDEPRRALPPNLLWYPDLCEVSDRGQRITIAQQHKDGTEVLSQGELTSLLAETREGIPRLSTAQQSLTELFLYMENEMHSLQVGTDLLNLLQLTGLENILPSPTSQSRTMSVAHI